MGDHKMLCQILKTPLSHVTVAKKTAVTPVTYEKYPCRMSLTIVAECRMSIASLRKSLVAASNLRNSCVTLSISK